MREYIILAAISLFIQLPACKGSWATNAWPAQSNAYFLPECVSNLVEAINERTLAAHGTNWTDEIDEKWISRRALKRMHDQIELLGPSYIRTNELGTNTTWVNYWQTNYTDSGGERTHNFGFPVFTTNIFEETLDRRIRERNKDDVDVFDSYIAVINVGGGTADSLDTDIYTG